nr:helix-turn-helix transcriptional regulator [Kibdelosporangium sp. MJ126-NF4]CEL13553.1 Putative transcriptional regulator [Kibdelosporangium sp. MJ126-NF4]CTQ99239.1 Putative transcriptional regulator [Kibdelosporangium sp. MJ126-NF4]
MDAAEREPELRPAEIGSRVRLIRNRRGMSLETAAGLAGISKSYLSMLENGERRFERRGLLEDIAQALGCSVVDLAGPVLPSDQTGVEARAALLEISVALYDSDLEDVPDGMARPVDELALLAAQANEHCANSRYSIAGNGLGAILTELHIHAVQGDDDTRQVALRALSEACIVAGGTARSLGNPDLAVHAARRAFEAARALDDPALVGFASMTRAGALARLGARHRAGKILTEAMASVESIADPTATKTTPAEALGMLHLAAAQMSAKNQDSGRAHDHLAFAQELATRTGERNHLWFSFGPANVLAWSLAVSVEMSEGPAAAEKIERKSGYDAGLHTADRKSALHFDLARAYAQADGSRDWDAVRHLDTADRIAPQKIRFDPIASELLASLDNRARRRSWELNSLRHRFGLS